MSYLSIGKKIVMAVALDTVVFEKGALTTRLGLATIKTAAIATAGAMTGIGVVPALGIYKAYKVTKLLAGTMKDVATSAEGLAAAGGFAFALKLAADLEVVHVAFETMLGSGERATKLLDDLQRFSGETPFRFQELIGASRNLMAFGLSDSQVIPTLRVIGNVASGTNTPLAELADLYGRIMITGRLYLDDINQLGRRGIPVIKELSKEYGVSAGAIQQMVAEGRIGFGDLQRVFQRLGEEGNLFHNKILRQSQTVNGKVTAIGTNLAASFRNLGEGATELLHIKGILDSIVASTQKLADATNWAKKLPSQYSIAPGASVGAWYRQQKQLHEANLREGEGAANGFLGVRMKGLEIDPAGRLSKWRAMFGYMSRYFVGRTETGEGWIREYEEAIEKKKKSEEAFKINRELNNRFPGWAEREIEANKRIAKTYEEMITPKQRYLLTTKQLSVDLAMNKIDMGTYARAIADATREMHDATGVSKRYEEALRGARETQKRARDMLTETLTPIDRYKNTISEAFVLNLQGALGLEQFLKVLKHAKTTMDDASKSKEQLNSTFRDDALRFQVERGLRGENLRAEHRLPREKLLAEVEDLYGLFRAGAIDETTLNRAIRSAENSLLGAPSHAGPSGARAGSVEAEAQVNRARALARREVQQGEGQRMLEEMKRQIRALQEHKRAIEENTRMQRQPFLVVQEELV